MSYDSFVLSQVPAVEAILPCPQPIAIALHAIADLLQIRVPTRPLLGLLLLLGCSCASALELRIGDTPARKIAKSTQIVGKGVPGECLVYATELSKKLQAAGIVSRVVAYHTRKVGAGDREHGQTKGHAVVVYNDNGRIYVMDNESWRPHRVAKGSLRGMIAQFGGMDQQIERAWAVLNPGAVPPIDADSRRVQLSGTR